MKLSEIVQKSGIEVKAEQKPKVPASSSAPRRRHFWDEEETTQTLGVSSALDKIPESKGAVSQALDSRETAIKSPEEKPLDSHTIAVSSALDKKKPKPLGVRQAFATALDVRESGVRKNEKSALDVNLLVGKEKTLVFLACEECRKIGSLETNYISTDDLKIKIAIDSNGLRNLIHRVKGKGFFEIEAKQLGRNGLRKFKIPQTIYQQFLSSPLDSRETGVSSAVGQALGTPLDEAPCSSSSLKEVLKETTTTEEPFWIDVPDQLKGQVQINQLRGFVKSGVIDQETLQNSLLGFAHDLEKNLVRSKNNNPIALFIGSLKNGGYVSHQFMSQQQAELKKIQERVEESKRLQAEIETLKLTEDFEKFRKEFPEKAEAFKPASSYVKSFEVGTIGYKLWLDEFKKSQETEQSPETP